MSWLLACLIFCYVSTATNAAVYLAQTGPPWTGQCNDACTEGAPCTLPSSLVQNSADRECDIFIASSISSLTFSFNNAAGTTTNLARYGSPIVAGPVGGTITLIIQNTLTISHSYTSVNFIVSSGGPTGLTVNIGPPAPLAPIPIGVDDWQGSTLTLGAGISTFNCYLSSLTFAATPFTLNGFPAPVVVIDGTIINVSSGPLFGGNSFNRLTIQQSAKITLGSYLTSASTISSDCKVTITDPGTQLTLQSSNGGGWLQTPASIQLEVLNGAQLLGSASEGGFNSLGILSSFRIQNSSLARIGFNFTSPSNSFDISNSLFLDCKVGIQAKAVALDTRVIANSSFTYSASAPVNTSLVLASVEGYQFKLDNVTLDGANATNYGAGALWFSPISGNSGTTSTSSIYTSKLILSDGASYTLGNLVVTHSITHDNETSSGTVFLLPHPTTITTWTFHSINISGVNVSISGTAQFVYRASSPLQGIQLIPPFITDILSTPNKILIDWAPEINPTTPISGYPYPVARFASQPSEITFSGFPIEKISVTSAFPASGPSILTYTVVMPATPTTPSTPSSSPPTNCLTPIPVGLECIDGQLVVTGPNVVIPPNLGIVQINGNLTTETVVFGGIGSTLNVSGCVAITGDITIELKGKDKNLPSGPAVLLTQDEGCSSSLLDVGLRVKEEKSCKKTKLSLAPSATKSSLAILMNVDNSACKTRWIILGSVLGVVVVLAAIGAIVGKVLYNQKMKTPE